MAEHDRTRGYRDNQAHRRPQPSAPAGDPLAELARLIGQQNESAPSYPPSAAHPAYGDQPQPDQGWAVQDPRAQRGGYHQDDGASHWPDHSAPAQHGDGQYAPHYQAGVPQAHSDYGAPPPSSYGDPRYADPRYADPQYADPQYPDAQYADPRYGDPRYGADPRQHDPRYADPRYDNGAAQGYSDPRYPEPNFDGYGSPYAPASQGYPQSGVDQGYPAQNYPSHAFQDGSHAYYGAQSAPRVRAPSANAHAPAKRRGSIVTVLAVLALAVVGTAAAFGYRAMFGGAGTPIPPPVIKADTQPSKIVPATDPNSKPIQDRIGVKTEKIVPRQEEPVQQAGPGQPRQIAPWLPAQNPQNFPPASANVAPPGSAKSAAPVTAEPKRIKTVPIKPQQGAGAPGPRSSHGGAAQPEETAAADSHAPMALAPTGSVAPSQRSSGRQAHAALTPNDSGAGSPFPTPIPASTAPARNAVSGPYAVQVTSQRSEADAQASFRSLQQQFPSVLGSRHPVIRRADLGERGTYYRAQIPFASQGEASEFCSSLKSAGGQCVVQRN